MPRIPLVDISVTVLPASADTAAAPDVRLSADPPEMRKCEWDRGRRVIAHINTPTTHAPISDAIAPPAIASNPIRERSCRRVGAIVLMPPIWMPTDAKFAK